MRLRHSYRVNHRLAYVLFALSLQHYSSIMRRILLVYTLYVGVYFVLFSRCMHNRVYRQFRARGPFLAVLGQGARGAFEWAAWCQLWRWAGLAQGPGEASSAGVHQHGVQVALEARVRLLVQCGYMQDLDIKRYRVSASRSRVTALSGGAAGHLWVRGRRLWLDRFIGGSWLPRLDYSLWVAYKQMQFHMDMGSRRGLRYRACLPVRGQRTRTNSRTVRRVTQALLNRF